MQREDDVGVSEHGSEEKQSTFPLHGTTPGLQSAAQSHANHLKWGDIAVSGFAPPALDGNEDSDVDDPCHHTSDRELRRRKMNRDRSMETLDAEARRIHNQRRYLFRRPRALQYFRGRMLVRSEEERGSGRLELFFDLTFVGIIAVLAEETIKEPTGASLVKYLVTYMPAYIVWSTMREIFNAFYKDDLSQRILVVFVMACLVIYGNNAPQAQGSLSQGPARAAAIGSYLIAEFAMFTTCLYYSFHIKAYRAQIRIHYAFWLISSGIWIGAIFVDDVRSAIAMAVVAMSIEYGGWIFAYTALVKKLFKLRYSSALAIDHIIERFNDFITIVLGEFVFSVFSGSPTGLGVHISAGRAVLAVMIAFCFQLLYMQGGGSKRITHPLRYAGWTGLSYYTLHIPIVSALTLCGDSMAELVKEDHVSSAIRWIACETYAIGMIGLWCLAMIECERDEKGELWLPKRARVAPRLIVGFVANFLPFTHQKEVEEEKEAIQLVRRAVEGVMEGGNNGGVDITTTKLLAILASMSFFALLWETITGLDGPNAPADCASQDYLNKADDGHTPKAALQTPTWKGYPTLCEPGSGTFDSTHQRDHRLFRSDTSDSGLSEMQSNDDS